MDAYTVRTSRARSSIERRGSVMPECRPPRLRGEPMRTRIGHDRPTFVLLHASVATAEPLRHPRRPPRLSHAVLGVRSPRGRSVRQDSASARLGRHPPGRDPQERRRGEPLLTLDEALTLALAENTRRAHRHPSRSGRAEDRIGAVQARRLPGAARGRRRRLPRHADRPELPPGRLRDLPRHRAGAGQRHDPVHAEDGWPR